MTDDPRDEPIDAPADDAAEHLAASVRRALLEPVAVDPSARDRAVVGALTEFDRVGATVLDLETARRQRYSRSLSAAAAVLLVAVGISVVVPDGGDDSGDQLEMSAESMSADSDSGLPGAAESRIADSDGGATEVSDSAAVMTLADEPVEEAASEPAEEPALEPLPVDEQLRTARNPAELQDLAFVWWERIRDGVAAAPTDHSCLVAGSSAVAIAEYLDVEVVVFYDGASGTATALARSDCSPVERGVPTP